MNKSDLFYWLWLTIAFGPANPRKWNLYSHLGSVKEVYERLSDGDMTGVLPKDIKLIKSATDLMVEKLIALCEQKEISIAHYDDPIYPQRLKEIYNPPSVLFYQGDISEIDKSIVITVVGTRKPSEYSAEVCRKLCTELVHAGASIASGFALGLDSMAHRSALKAGGKTYAVLPCGILNDYPAENAGSKRIIASQGAVISEYFPGDKASPLTFRARNRILSGIGLGTLIIQAGMHSGSLSTASFAVSQGRDIFCVPPHDIYDSSYDGVKKLIRDGAVTVLSAEDILDEYAESYPHILGSVKPATKKEPEQEPANEPKKEHKQGAALRRQKTEAGGRNLNSADNVNAALKRQAEEKIPKKAQEETDSVRNAPYTEELIGTKKEIYDFIKERGEAHLDELAVGIGDVHELEAFLTELELDGHIRSLPGNRFTV